MRMERERRRQNSTPRRRHATSSAVSSGIAKVYAFLQFRAYFAERFTRNLALAVHVFVIRRIHGHSLTHSRRNGGRALGATGHRAGRRRPNLAHDLLDDAAGL